MVASRLRHALRPALSSVTAPVHPTATRAFAASSSRLAGPDSAPSSSSSPHTAPSAQQQPQQPQQPQTSYSDAQARAERETHFGFRTVREEDKAGLVRGVFSSVASSYDIMNTAMSAGIHHYWKDQFVKALDPRGGIKVLDVAGGTGDIAERILDHARTVHHDRTTSVKILDINPQMLRQGQRRMLQTMYWNTPQLSFALGNAEDLTLIMTPPVPRSKVAPGTRNTPPLPPLLTEKVESESIDLYTIAYGIRNVTDIQKALNDAYRVLKPGGIFACLEFSRPPNPTLAELYRLYSFNVIPLLGQILASDRDSYQYLVESIQRFPSQPDFARMMKKAGFKLAGADVEAKRWGGVLEGFGVQDSSDGDSTVDGAWRDMTFGITTMWVGTKL